MPEVVECIYESGVLKPLGKVIELKEGEKVKVRIEKKIEFEPIRLKKSITIERILKIRNELWTSF
jgi:predicted DNA-binding antitoxin AbrB/MazE fold protein